MIGKQDILDRAAEWQLRPEVVEKDYVLGWLLVVLGRHPDTAEHWLFKGGTCLKKCYFETYRFSEDLDFTLAEPAHYGEADLLRILKEVTAEASALSGIAFPEEAITIRQRKDKLDRMTFQGRVGYRGPLSYPGLPRVLLDLTQHEPILDGLHRQPIYHPYPDDLPAEATVAAYSLDELFAEKTRALFERSRPRDLYDVVYILENRAEVLNLSHTRDLFDGKCRGKGLSTPSADQLLALVQNEPELRSEWANMLAHQLPQLPPLDSLLARLPNLLRWIDAPMPEVEPLPAATSMSDGEILVAPAGVQLWRTGVPLEAVRFAGANRLLIEFTYHGRRRLAEPYSLRRARTGNLLLYVFERAAGHIKAFNVAEIHDLRVTDTPFSPRYRIEFSSAGPLPVPGAHARPRSVFTPPQGSLRSPRRTRLPSDGPVYVFQCPYCNKEFRHRKNDSKLRKHKDASGYANCSGRRGHLLRIDSSN